MKGKIWLCIVCAILLTLMVSHYVAAQGPTIAIYEPMDGAIVQSGTVPLRATVTSPQEHPLEHIEVWVNGLPVLWKDKGMDPVLPGEIDIDIQLEEGENQVAILATNDLGSAWQVITVTYTPSPVPRPNLYILAIGIADYERDELDLSYADIDARDMVDVFAKQEGPLFGAVEARLLLNEEATRGNILNGLEWICREVTQRDLAIIFVSGHGVRHEVRGDYYFLPYDGDPASVIDTAILWFEFERRLTALAGKTVFFVDTCHAGGVTGVGMKSAAVNLEAIRDFATAGWGAMVMASSTGGEFSREDLAWGHGAFTKAILDGLAGGADYDRNGVIYTAELNSYVTTEVKELTGGAQHPTTETTTEYTSFPLFVLFQRREPTREPITATPRAVAMDTPRPDAAATETAIAQRFIATLTAQAPTPTDTPVWDFAATETAIAQRVIATLTAQAPTPTDTPTPNLAATETAIAQKVIATLTAQAPTPTDTPTPTTVSAQRPEEWFAEVAKPYAGTTIKGISETNAPSRYIKEVLAPKFEELTGIKVKFEVTSWGEMYDKEIEDMEAGTGIYDFVYMEQDFIYEYLDRRFLVNLTALMEEKPELLYPDLDMSDFTTYIDNFRDAEGHVYGLPFEAFLKVYLYRKDLFGDPDIQAAFKGKYGYELRPAVNFEQYADIAEFFTEYGKENNMGLWGTTVQAGSHPAAFYEMVETIWPSWGVYNWGINMKNWRATSANDGTLDSVRAIEALAFWVGMLKYAPPEARVSTWDEVAATFAGGRAAQGWVYGENAAWIATDETRSTVAGKVGVALPPLYPGVINEASRGQGYIGYYDGGALSIPWCSSNREATLLFLQWVSLKEFQGDFAAKTDRVVRTSTFSDPLVLEMDPEVGNYYTLFKEYGHLFKGGPPFPFHTPVREVMLPYILEAIAGEMTPEEACIQMAVAVDKELARLGY